MTTPVIIHVYLLRFGPSSQKSWLYTTKKKTKQKKKTREIQTFHPQEIGMKNMKMSGKERKKSVTVDLT